MFDFKQPTLLAQLLKLKMEPTIPTTHRFEIQSKIRPMARGKRRLSLGPRMPSLLPKLPSL